MTAIALRAPEPEDLDLLYTIENDTDTWDICSAKVDYSKFTLKKYLATQPQDIASARELRLIITDAESNKAVGLIDLTNYSAINGSAEIGITILKEERKKGYGKSAVKEMERYAKNFLNLRMLYAHTLACNLSEGKNLFLACNYIPVATLPEWHYNNGKYVDLTVFKKNL